MNELNELGDLGNTKLSRTRYKRCAFTLNNYNDDELNSIIKGFDLLKLEYIIGKEIGKDGTPHLQGYVEFKKQIYFSGLKKINERIHWEHAKYSKKINIEYCSKDNDYISTFKLNKKDRLLRKYEGVIWKGWQLDVIDIMESEPDSRTIYWYWETSGNVGKSFLCKYLYLKYNCIIADGKKDNVFNQIKIWLDNNEDQDPRIIICDIPRCNLEYINMGTIEQIKNGLVYSGKYEGGVCVFDHPHIIIFANKPPNLNTMSMDRWNIKEIK